MVFLKKPILPKSYIEREGISFWRKWLRKLTPSSEIYIPVPRIHPDLSSIEIGRRREDIGHELKARLYLFRGKLIVSSVAGISEYGQPTVLPFDGDVSRLGLCLCDHLLQFRPKTPPSPPGRNAKLKDWKVLQASGAKSAWEFQENAWVVLVETMNSAILINAGPYNSLHKEIKVQGMTSLGPHEDIGNTVPRTLKAASVLRENGVI
jgi:hypothetical protein